MTAQKVQQVFAAAAFEKDVKAARDASRPTKAEEDAHLQFLEYFTTGLGVVGLVFAVRGVISPVSMIALGMYNFAKFAILAHHSLHGGWGISRRGSFARGFYRRMVDWLDWIFPMAWIVEHNKVHHYYLNEDQDPDYVQRNSQRIHEADWPMPVKYFVTFFLASIWKWWYYASNTMKTLHADKPGAPTKEVLDEPITLTYLLFVAKDAWHRGLAKDLILNVMAPNFIVCFVLIPMLGGVVQGSGFIVPFSMTTLLNILGAELFTNLHAWATIVTNHAGSDLWYFTEPCKADTAEFYLRCVLASTAYPAGNELYDYFHGYLNYQGEHHAFPNLSPLHYRRFHPLFKGVCAKYGVPYVQENIVIRCKKTAEVHVGAAKHKVLKGRCVDQPELWMIQKKEA